MIAQLLPPGVIAVEAFEDVPGESPFPGEEFLVSAAVEQRRREFVTARRCARDALGRLGVPPQAILPGPGRAPRWPPGVVGSITHCAGYRAAAVAFHTAVAGIGIDAEPHAPLPTGVFGTVTVAAEREHLADLTRSAPTTCWDRLLFSAKEAVFKAWFPLTGLPLDFDEATVQFGPGRFTARVRRPGPRTDGGPDLAGFTGRWTVARGLVLSAVTVAAVTRPTGIGVGPGK